MTFDSTVKFVHVVLAIGVFGLHVSYGLSLAAGPDAQVLRGIKRLADRLVIPGYVLLFVTGVILVLRGPWDFTEPWVAASSVLFVVGAAVVVVAYLPALRSQLDALSREGARSPAYRAAARRAGLAGGVSGALVVVVGYLMITKPG